jgi:hypothetical protein
LLLTSTCFATGSTSEKPRIIANTITVLGVEVQRCCLTTSLYRLRKFHACEDRYQYLRDKLGKAYGDKAPINILTILAHNGVDDALWALCAVEQDCEQVARLMAADFAEEALPLFEAERPDDQRPRVAIEMTRRHAVGKVGAAAWDAARDAAWAAARDAAWAAARDAAWAAARAAARDAAWAAAWDAARAAARDEQSEIMRRYMVAGEKSGSQMPEVQR